MSPLRYRSSLWARTGRHIFYSPSPLIGLGQLAAPAGHDMVNTYIQRTILEDWHHGDFDSTCS